MDCYLQRHCRGADVILIPEQPFDVDKVAAKIRMRHDRGRYFSIVVVAEGAKFAAGKGLVKQTDETDEFGTPGWAESATRWPRRLSAGQVLKHER